MTQQLMFYISKRPEVRNVIYVDRDLYVVGLMESLSLELWSWEGLKKWKSAIFRQIQRVQDKVWVYTPFHYLPFSQRDGWIKGIDRKIILSGLSGLCKGVESKDVILFINRKIPIEIIDHFGEVSVRCFYWSDDWSSFPVGTKRITDIMVHEREESERNIRDILERCDIVFTMSEALREKGKPFVSECYWLPCGTNFENFSRANFPETEIPAEVENLSRPIIGLMGFISSSIDFNLLAAAAIARPEWSFVVIGPKLPAASWGQSFFKLKNVYYLGAKSYFELPKYMKAFDVCIIPYVRDESLKMADSNKVYDYLATGKPIVVSENTAGVGRFADLIRISNGPKGFIDHIEESLREKDPALREKRQQIAKENSWEMRANQVWERIIRRVEG